MEFNLSIPIDRSPNVVFTFLREVENHPQEEKSKVLLIEKITHGPVNVGTRYREVVQMFPLIRGEMISEVTRYEPNECIQLTWQGGGIEGVLTYYFEYHNGGTRLILHETVTLKGVMRLVKPMIQRMFHNALVKRLQGIKQVLESSITNELED